MEKMNSTTEENNSSAQAFTKALHELNDESTHRERQIAETAGKIMKETVELAKLADSASHPQRETPDLDTDAIMATLKAEIGKLKEVITSLNANSATITGGESKPEGGSSALEMALYNAVSHNQNLNAVAASVLSEGVATMYSIVGGAFGQKTKECE